MADVTPDGTPESLNAVPCALDDAPMIDTTPALDETSLIEAAGEVITIPDPEPLPSGPDFAYTEYAKAPEVHKLIARHAAVGWADDRKIADIVGRSVKTVRDVKRHPPIARHIEGLVRSKAAQFVDRTDKLDEIVDDGLKRMHMIITDPESQDRDAIKATELGMDRHPSGQFVKTTRREQQGRIEIFDNTAVARVKRLAAMDTTFRPVESDPHAFSEPPKAVIDDGSHPQEKVANA